MKWKTVCSGEDLFLKIRDNLLVNYPTSRAWSTTGEAISNIGGSAHFLDFYRGATAMLATRRILAYCSEFLQNATETTHVPKTREFLVEMFPGGDTSLVSNIARLAVDAHRASGSSVSKALKKGILGKFRELQCYLCGRRLDPIAADGTPTHVSMDHIWPASLGGTTAEENLLPACRDCQNKKADNFSWEWVSAYNLSWTSSHNSGDKEHIASTVCIARHFHHASELASEQHMTMREALEEIGNMTLRFERTGRPMSFFHMYTRSD
jgi:5-methylcytosine-specific restriction endonuclease McrA